MQIWSHDARNLVNFTEWSGEPEQVWEGSRRSSGPGGSNDQMMPNVDISIR